MSLSCTASFAVYQLHCFLWCISTAFFFFWCLSVALFLSFLFVHLKQEQPTFTGFIWCLWAALFLFGVYQLHCFFLESLRCIVSFGVSQLHWFFLVSLSCIVSFLVSLNCIVSFALSQLHCFLWYLSTAFFPLLSLNCIVSFILVFLIWNKSSQHLQDSFGVSQHHCSFLVSLSCIVSFAVSQLHWFLWCLSTEFFLLVSLSCIVSFCCLSAALFFVFAFFVSQLHCMHCWL